jgi:hypothetical protein
MANWVFNPFTDELDYAGSGGGSSYIDGVADTAADLPVTLGNPPLDAVFVVKQGSGVWLINRKPAGLYCRIANNGDLDDWEYLGAFPEVNADGNWALYNSADPTKELKFDVSGVSASTVRTLTVPDKNITLDDATDSRTPTSHASSHFSAGADPIAPSDIGAAVIGTDAGQAQDAQRGVLTKSSVRAESDPDGDLNSDYFEVADGGQSGRFYARTRNTIDGYIGIETLDENGERVCEALLGCEGPIGFLESSGETFAIRQSGGDRANLEVANAIFKNLANDFTATFDVQEQLSDDVTLAIPDQSGTIAITSDIPDPSAATPQALGAASAGTSDDYSRGDHIHAAPALNDLSNVSAATPSDNDVLVFDTATSTWVAEAPAASGIAETLLDAKGDLIVASAADTAARLAVGTNGHVLTADSGETTGVKWAAASYVGAPIEYVIACSDETSDLTTGTAKVTFRAPVAFLLTGVAASVNTAPTGSTLIVDINNGANSTLSTKLSIDADEKTSATAASAAVIDTDYDDIAADAEITIDIDQIGSTVAGKGLKVVLKGVRA